MDGQQITEIVRTLTDGCTEPGAYEQVYADIKPRRRGWARGERCGDISPKGGIIQCKNHPSVGGVFHPYSWQRKV
jgi:hypothetical protein